MQFLVAVVHGFEVFAVQAVVELGLVAPLEVIWDDVALKRVEGDLVLRDLGVGVEGLVAGGLAHVIGGWVGCLLLGRSAREPALCSEVVGASLGWLRAPCEVLVAVHGLLLQVDEGGGAFWRLDVEDCWSRRLLRLQPVVGGAPLQRPVATVVALAPTLLLGRVATVLSGLPPRRRVLLLPGEPE